MRLLDIVALLVVALAALAVFLPRTPLAALPRHLPMATLLVAGAHLAVAFRPFFVPLYGLALLTAWGANPRRQGPVWMRRMAGITGVAALAAGAALAWAFPLVTLPAPDGPYAIGTRELVLVDSARAEELTPEPNDRRVLPVRVWYPADSAVGPAQPLLSRDRARALASALGVPRFVLDHLGATATHSHPAAPLSAREARWPVVVFSHGFGIGYEAQNTVQMEALASHGYVVVSILHPYEALATRLPDGRVAAVAPEPPPPGADTARMRTTFARLGTERDTAALVQVIRDAHAFRDLRPSVDRWTADTRFVLDELARRGAAGAPDALFPGRLATDRVGIFGMSFGGATAANFCTLDARCAGGMNLDGLTFGDATDTPMPRPFFFVSGAPNREMHTLFFQRATAPAWSMTVARTQHLDFTDFGWFSPLPAKVGMLGGIEAARMHAIMNDAVLAFFGATLRGQPFDPGRLTRHADVSLTRRAP